jgi:hypothetical protein
VRSFGRIQRGDRNDRNDRIEKKFFDLINFLINFDRFGYFFDHFRSNLSKIFSILSEENRTESKMIEFFLIVFDRLAKDRKHFVHFRPFPQESKRIEILSILFGPV